MRSFLTLFLLTSCIQIVISQQSDFETIRQRVIAELLKHEVSDSLIESILAKIKDDGSFKDINYEDLSRRAGFPHRYHTYGLVELGRAYRTPQSQFHQDQDLFKIITGSLRYWVENDFFGDNWHNNQISTPTNLVNLMLLVGDDLPRELVDQAQPMIGRAHMNASGARPSGDRIVIAGILAKNLLFIRDKVSFEEIIRLIEGEVKFSTGQRGMQHDYSFHHRYDRVNNTTSYGYGKYANAFGEWSYYVANTKYAFSVEKINHLVDYYLDGVYKQLVYGIYTDISVKNRSITRQTTFEPRDTVEIKRLLFGTDYRSSELVEILKLRKGEIMPIRSFAKFFWQTEHFVVQRPHFYTTVRMYSTRNRNMEEPYNGPGKPTHHRADGTNYIQLRGNEYHDIWPVYDWQKISGATIVQKPQWHDIDIIQLDGMTDFVGAVEDGQYGAVGFDFISPHDRVMAKKSWFFFENEYICLGAGISLKENKPVVTTVDQVKQRGEVITVGNGERHRLMQGEHNLERVKGAYHGEVAYILPEEGSLHVANKVQEGRWSDITDQKNISDELIKTDVFSAWFDHGERPQDQKYAYIVVPNISEDEFVASCENNRSLEILVNSDTLQAVEHRMMEMTQAVFYKAGKINTTQGVELKINSQGAVMLKTEGSYVRKLSVADPSRKLDYLWLEISGKYDVNDGTISTVWDKEKNNTLFFIKLPQGVYTGKSVQINLKE